VFQMFAHGIMTALFFSSVGYIYDRTHTKAIAELGGLSKTMPRAASFFIIAGNTTALGQYRLSHKNQGHLYLAPHLETGLFVGVGLSIFIFLLRSMRPIFVEVSRHEDGTLRDAEEHHLAVAQEISVFRFDMPLYFANAGYLEDMVLDSIAKKPELKYVILDMEPITIIDATGEEVLHALTTRLRNIGIDLLISRTKHHVQDVFDESGFTELLGKGNFFRTRNAAITFALNNLGIKDFEESPLNPDMSGYARGMTDRTI